MSATLLRIFRLGLYFALTLPLMPVQAVLVLAKSPLAHRLARRYHRWTSRLMGFRVTVKGERSRQHPTLYVSNHMSYVDIEILGGLIDGCFVAKSDVAHWPLFGWLAKLQQCVFVDRQVRSTAEQRDAIRRRLDAGDNLILFPEATSGDGTRLLPFKSALLSVADYAGAQGPLLVQPVSIVYLRLDGIPLGRSYRPFFAWYGDMSLAPHLWEMMGLGTVDVEVVFHPPVTLAELGARKALTEHCYRTIAASVASALAGRPQDWPTPAPELAAAPPPRGAMI
jgi:1-acyl-sn-glycerol-3-phosphate acyltransferase